MKAALLILLVFAAGCVGPGVVVNTLAERFSCENDNSVESRGYVLLMGLGEHNKHRWAIEKAMMESDPKSKFALIYDQDENLHIEEISKKFLEDMDTLLKEHDVEELVIFGSSAGGVTASYSISRLNFSGSVALHTMASPLKGYGLTGAKAQFLGDRKGYLRDIAVGFGPFGAPGSNVKAYHHKTVTDSVLKEHYCGNMAAFCDVKEIQGNNLAGSREFYYPSHDHETIMSAVVKEVVGCYNPKANVTSIDEAPPRGLGNLCYGSDCEVFCKDNLGLCNEQCKKEPENPLCQKPFGFETQVAKNADGRPVLKSLGLKIEPWDRNTNMAGDLIFSRDLIFDDGRISNDKPFIEFGHADKYSPERMYIENWFFVPLGTKVRAPVDGYASVSFFEHTNDWGINIAPIQGSQWFVSFEHLVDMKISDGSYVKAGDVVGSAAPRSTFGNKIAMVELAVWKGGREIVKFCPFSFLEESAKPAYGQKLRGLASDWEQFLGKNIYQQEKWEEPGCLMQSIIER